jgi:predicted nucleic acid-binding protein
VRFADTSFWVALRYRGDVHHADAARLWADQRHPILTSNHVVGETWTFIGHRLGHGVARQFVESVTASKRVAIRHVDEQIEHEAWEWLLRHDERPYSFVDATSFALMRRLRIREALAFDDDFTVAGFTEARSDRSR